MINFVDANSICKRKIAHCSHQHLLDVVSETEWISNSGTKEMYFFWGSCSVVLYECIWFPEFCDHILLMDNLEKASFLLLEILRGCHNLPPVTSVIAQKIN